MHQRRLYTLAFLLVLLAAGVGAYLARQVVGDIEPPQLDAIETVGGLVADLDLGSLLPSFGPLDESSDLPVTDSSETLVAEVEGQPTAGPVVTADTSQPPPVDESATPGPEQPLVSERPTATPAPSTPTPTPGAADTAVPSYAFVPAGEVRHSTGDCPGPSIRGAVRDASGNLQAGVRLWRYDQWGNEQTVETKIADADVGQYDFPLGDTANIHYVQVVDASGVPVSPVIEVEHRQGDALDATCHWLDWIRR